MSRSPADPPAAVPPAVPSALPTRGRRQVARTEAAKAVPPPWPEASAGAEAGHGGANPSGCAVVDPSPIEALDTYGTKSLDRAANAHLARFTLGISPYGLASTFFSWWIHLLGAPGKQLQLLEKAARKNLRFAIYLGALARDAYAEPCIAPLPHDHRFDHPGWRVWPYNVIHQGFLLNQQWWHNATCGIDGVSARDARLVSFLTRQMLDLASPSNFLATNPELAETTLREGGANLVQGFRNVLEDWERAVSGKPPVGAEQFRPGREVAVTPGRVVLRTRLLELIQYAPSTSKVQAEPLLIVPAWIMKYYILDLSPHNSLVKHLVAQGFTVFMISWRNPTARDRDMGMDDYFDALSEALTAVNAIVPGRKIHALGYCLGGTLLAAKAAQMARDADDRLASLTLFASQTDFSEPGELQLFVNESQVAFLENMMWDQGYLDTRQMAGVFQLLRSADLIWSRYVHEYLMGRRPEMFDLMAWNADATRMPYKMHGEYLRRLYLGNELAEGTYELGGRPVTIGAIRVPIFCVATLSDHIAPWRSVYKLHLLSQTELTFVLTNGGHNAGIVSEPGHEGRRYGLRTTPAKAPYLTPEAWQQSAEPHEGSWWPALEDWLARHSSGKVDPPQMGSRAGRYAPLDAAPGQYVFQR